MKKTVNYDEALVTYLDILGFRELVQGEAAGRISRTIRLVRDAIKPDRDRARVYEMTYQSFSDLAVISIPILTAGNITFRPGVLHSQIVRVATAQVELLEEGIVLRGGITFGSIVRSYGQLFGPALIRAYDLERTIANYPRIVVDDVVFRELDRNPALTKRGFEHEKTGILALLDKGEDGVWFIDYLRAVHSEAYPELFRRMLKRHRQVIKDKLREFEGNKKILEKYEWLRSYHNRTVEQLRMRRADRLMV
jgi:hypothetical protein